jgi:pyruvate-formate lyase-activating enzyme
MKTLLAPIIKTIPFSWVDGPGNRFVIFTQGCNFDCLACHNPQTIPMYSVKACERDVDSLIVEIRSAMPFISGVTFSGGEATLHSKFILELFSKMHEDKELETLTRFIDSNGNVPITTWKELIQVTDGVMLDLKALEENKHIALANQSNSDVLESIKYLAANGCLHEVRLLLIPEINDSDEELASTAKWLMAIDPEMQIRVNAFNNHGVRSPASSWRTATKDDVSRYLRILKESGALRVVTNTSISNLAD